MEIFVDNVAIHISLPRLSMGRLLNDPMLTPLYPEYVITNCLYNFRTVNNSNFFNLVR